MLAMTDINTIEFEGTNLNKFIRIFHSHSYMAMS